MNSYTFNTMSNGLLCAIKKYAFACLCLIKLITLYQFNSIQFNSIQFNY